MKKTSESNIFEWRDTARGGAQLGALPLWNRLRTQANFQALLSGIKAAVVGLLLAACYHPVWTSAIHAPGDFALGLLDFLLLAFWKWPPGWSSWGRRSRAPSWRASKSVHTTFMISR